jgi:hypothetical protein
MMNPKLMGKSSHLELLAFSSTTQRIQMGWKKPRYISYETNSTESLFNLPLSYRTNEEKDT